MSKLLHNKSSEKLVQSDTSIEELFVPPLELKKIQMYSDENETPRTTDNINAHTIVVIDRADIHYTGQNGAPRTETPPVPAVRKSLLTPTKNTNGKDRKNSQNELKQQQHIVIQNSHEKSIPVKPTRKSIRNVNAKRNFSSNTIELVNVEKKKAEKKIKKKLFGEKSEETTSFVSYEEKHESEINMENHSNNSFIVSEKNRLEDSDIEKTKYANEKIHSKNDEKSEESVLASTDSINEQFTKNPSKNKKKLKEEQKTVAKGLKALINKANDHDDNQPNKLNEYNYDYKEMISMQRNDIIFLLNTSIFLPFQV